ncbi:S1 family peptidase [Streptomyces sp. NPDC055037]
MSIVRTLVSAPHARRRRRGALVVSLAAVAGVMATATPSQAIIGGSSVPAAESWMVSLYNDSSGGFCGGTLIDRQWVLTAAHCVAVGRDMKDLRVRVGSDNKSAGGTVADVSDIVAHPSWAFSDGAGDGTDLALLKLKQPVDQKPLKLNKKSPAVGTPARVLGWGNMCIDDDCWPEKLQEVTLPVSEKRDGRFAIQDKESRGVAPGDSGGPLVVKDKGAWRLAGVTSNARELGDGAGAESNFTDVAQYRDWISEIIR